jgi:hypothetical protein
MADVIKINGRPVRRGSAVCWADWRRERFCGFVVAADGPDGRRAVIQTGASAVEAQELLDRIGGAK